VAKWLGTLKGVVSRKSRDIDDLARMESAWFISHQSIESCK
jgi:hypothetical protein